MTENRDPLSDLLDRHPGEPVPEDFAIRVMNRIRVEPAPHGRLLAWPRRIALAAGALVVLGLGYWLGMGAPALREPQRIGIPGDVAVLDLQEIYRNRDLLESWELLVDPEVQLGLADALAEASALGASAPNRTEEPR